MPLERHESPHGRNDEVATWDSDDLPESLQEMSDVIGLEAVQTFVGVYGGTRLTVPQKMPDDHPLAELLGTEVAGKLSEHYALERVDVPRAHFARMHARNRRLCADHHAGESVRQLALQYRLTERRVWEILAEERNNAPK
tara:strand:+ start:8572 stop:8991 length:420 start_codon:yes stop_codon:yes gene_type:complete